MNYLFIDWQPHVEAFQIGSFSVRWYALFWAIGLVAAYYIVKNLYKHQGISLDKFDPLFLYCFFGILIGARLGHCLFYEPEYYLGSTNGIIEMFLPIKILPDGSWKFHGYAGLASHGGAIGCFFAMLIYSKRNFVRFTTVLDNVCIATPLTAFCIRMGNLMNSEIIGSQTDVPWAFLFHTNESMVGGAVVPRHPAQLYEAIAYFIIFIVLLLVYWRLNRYGIRSGAGTGLYFGLCLTLIFTFRFFVEFIKKEQVDFEKGMALDMGQLLSIPFIIAGAWFTIRGIRLFKKYLNDHESYLNDYANQ
ncbi:MAG: prolipoprotein diacylglyceryl transferase [Bacteroidaceae bacterium]|nr:prolipoprotein diacylglyceryl transferase [Bacteroidaceae bacterium]